MTPRQPGAADAVSPHGCRSQGCDTQRSVEAKDGVRRTEDNESNDAFYRVRLPAAGAAFHKAPEPLPQLSAEGPAGPAVTAAPAAPP